MKFAIVNGQRQEAQRHLVGECPSCGHPMIAKCGERKVDHWAHKGRRICDPWWENETEWHRAWKGHFPVAWQEFSQTDAASGERHIADVKTDGGWVLEFQHSFINPEERRSREGFYAKLVWVVDGARRKKDRPQFTEAWNLGQRIGATQSIRRVSLDVCMMLREWADSPVVVFFDFGEDCPLFWLLGLSNSNGFAYLGAFPRPDFIRAHLDSASQTANEFDALVADFPKLIASYESPVQARAVRAAPSPPAAAPVYWGRTLSRRRRF